LVAEISRLVPIAQDRQNPMARVARFLVDSLLWCWTADGIDEAGNAVRDGLKYDLRHQRHTAAAHDLWVANGFRGAGLRHEHAVPRRVLLEHLLTLQEPLPKNIASVLEPFCFAVIVSTAEDAELRRRRLGDAMPEGWTFAGGRGNAMARYVAAELAGTVRTPDGLLIGAG
jgi:hypothetical protein